MKSNRSRINIKLMIVLLEIFVLILISIVSILSKKKNEKENTRDNPYIIASTEDLVDFANMVRDGYNFKDEYVLMTNDIDLEGVWVPVIGVADSGNYFEGIFDGGGHRIYNIYSGVDVGDCSLFGTLGGTVMNLGIEPGTIQGATCGSIASHSVDENARIINCYNKASLYGGYTGGIAGNFDGKIINCVSMCELNGEHGRGNILCYGSSEVINCFSIYDKFREDTHNKEGNYVNFYLDGEKYTSVSQFLPDICDELNVGEHILSIECPDIPSGSCYQWEITEGGQSIRFSSEKMKFYFTDRIISEIIYRMRQNYVLYTICAVALIYINVLILTNGVGRIGFISIICKR